ncbi:hypothetical protein HGRIS_006997 [Hohenbuehelia grisea]|uniref:Cytochrome P450 n=1 Tax=Hohenbuehelia grisea TaxID=104357 RepID=A0ABR3JAU5_9AGAR
MQVARVHQLLRRLAQSAQAQKYIDISNQFRTFAASLFLYALYGHEVQGADDSIVILTQTLVANIQETFFPGAMLVNALPFLRHLPAWFPGAGFKRFANEQAKLVERMTTEPLETVKRNLFHEPYASSLAGRMLRENAEHDGGSKEQEEIIKHVLSVSYIGAWC